MRTKIWGLVYLISHSSHLFIHKTNVEHFYEPVLTTRIKWQTKIMGETSLVVQRLRTCLPTQGTWVWSLIWEQRLHVPWGTKPVLQVLSPLTTATEDYVLQSPCSATVRSPCTATRESLLAATQSPWAITNTQCSQKIYESNNYTNKCKITTVISAMQRRYTHYLSSTYLPIMYIYLSTFLYLSSTYRYW